MSSYMPKVYLCLLFSLFPCFAQDGKTADTHLRELINAQLGRAILSPSRMEQMTERLALDDQMIDLFLVGEAEVGMIENRLEQLGARNVQVQKGRVWLRLPLNELSILASEPWVRYLMPALAPAGGDPEVLTDDLGRGNTTITDGFGRVNATEYHDAGYRGQGVKIGIIDVEFDNLANVIAAGEAVNPVRQFSCNTGGCVPVATVENANEGPHGTACFEIIYDLAPDAQYYLVDINNGTLQSAVQALINEGVHIISVSLGWPISSGPTDGRDLFMLNDAVRLARQSDVLMVIAAGNEQSFFYNGIFTDSDQDGLHEFEATVNGLTETMQVLTNATSTNLIMTWDEWADGDLTQTQRQDAYQLEILNVLTNTVTPVPASANFPIISTTLAQGTYRLSVRRTGNQGDPKAFRIQLGRGSWIQQFGQGAPSIASPAESTRALIVGAVDSGHLGRLDNLEPYSSQGPGGNGAVKPDVVSYANVSTQSYGNQNRFNGTSSATPHVAGMAAIIVSLNSQARGQSIDFLAPGNPGLGYFQRNARDRGPRGVDNQYGWGVAQLPLLGAPVVELVSPNTTVPANVRANLDGERINVTFSVRSQAGDFLGGLEQSQLSVRVGSEFAAINSLIQLDQEYVVNVTLPNQSAGSYNLRVGVDINQQSGADSESDAVIYSQSTTVNVDTMLVIDRSGSMAGSAINSAKNAAQFFVDLTSDGDQIGVASYSNSSVLNWPLTLIESVQANDLFTDNVENGGGDWNAQSPWARTTDSASSGSFSWTDSPLGSYENNANVSLTLNNSVDLSSLSTPTLTIQTRYDLESGFDYGNIEISIDNGQSWLLLQRLSGISDWSELSFDLSAFSNQTIRLRFRLTSDFTITRDGWYIDDIRVGDFSGDPRQAVKAAIAAINSGGGTSIGSGLQDALDEFLRAGDSAHPWTGVVLTDGFENASPRVRDVMPAVLNTRMRLFTIGLGSSIDENLLRQMAQDTGGQYFNAPTNNELQAIYGSISGEILNRETLVDRTATLDEGQIIREPFFIDSSTSEAFVSISWPIQGDEIELSLISPSGVVIDATSQNPDVEYQEGATFASYRLTNPEAGRWEMDIFGISVTRQVEPVWIKAFENDDRSILDDLLAENLWLVEQPSRGFNSASVTLQVQAESDLEMNVLADQDRYGAGETIELRVFLNSDDLLQVLTSVTALVTLPDGAQVSAGQFRDDGLGGDDLGGDGVFTGVFTNTSQIGNYTVQVFAAGVTPDLQSFERLKSFATVVDPGTDSDFDGMPNDWEFRWALEGELPLNPFLNDAAEDIDQDGLTNLEEFQRGTNPLRQDSDEDGLIDGDEVTQTLTDPSADDTDGGGERDGAEVAAGRDPLNGEDDVPCILGAESEQLFYVQGVDPITFSVQFTCVRPGMTLEFVNTQNGQVLGADQNPFTAPSLFTGPTDVELRFTGSFAAQSQSARLRVLASQNPRYRDYDNDGCNTSDDLLGVIADAWNQPLQNGGDADGDGVFSLLDLFFINTDGCSNRDVHYADR